jgi:probable phosphoglycerate mutase
MSSQQIWLVRHGETEWSISGQHTGRTDLPLTPEGENRAEALGRYLRDRVFTRVLTSPLKRAFETCRIAGYGEVAQVNEDLLEWNYGVYEGRTTAEIRETSPGWDIWSSGVPKGESVDEVGIRAQRVIQQLLQFEGNIALFGHGHMLRILTACWLELPPREGRRFHFGTAALGVLGFERETRVVQRWNLETYLPR